MKVLIPPVKCQGIKSKLVLWLTEVMQKKRKTIWVEPFMGSGVVGFNFNPPQALFCDTNPHLIRFYQEINDGVITPSIVRKFLETEGKNLAKHGEDYYYKVRDRFNIFKEPLDFLFLNRSCFNGLMRFNRKGYFNVPFGHKPERFSKAYITKIVNQVAWVSARAQANNWTFKHQDFRATLSQIDRQGLVYCDPPYVGRHTDYFNGWTEADELSLYEVLKNTKNNFVLSTWHSNQHRNNPFVKKLWSEFNIITREHFYHIGASETNRKPVIEALVTRF